MDNSILRKGVEIDGKRVSFWKSLHDHKYMARQRLEELFPRIKNIAPLAHRDTLRYATHEMRLEILARDRYTCQYCKAHVTMNTARMDHIIPWSKGGPTILDNLTTSCDECNMEKFAFIKKPESKRVRHALQQVAQSSRHIHIVTINGTKAEAYKKCPWARVIIEISPEKHLVFRTDNAYKLWRNA